MRQPADTEWKQDAAREAGSKKISMTKGGAGSDGAKREWRGWETTTKEMMYVDGIGHEGVENNSHHKD